MKFFIPAADSPEAAEQVYGAIKQFLSEHAGAKFSDRRICFLRWWHESKEYIAEVGKPTPFNGEIVVAILYEDDPGRKLYHVCTGNRGVVRGMSILAGGDCVMDSTDFDP